MSDYIPTNEELATSLQKASENKLKSEELKMNQKTKKLVMSAMLAALICIATMLIKIPSPFKGYMNLGDAFVLLAGWMLSPAYGFFAAGIGSALADIFSGFAVYAPVTFVIKAAMAVIAYFGYAAFSKKTGRLFSRILSAAIAEIVMALGYFAFEGFLYGYEISALNMPLNLVQGIAGLIAGVVLIKIFEKKKFL